MIITLAGAALPVAAAAGNTVVVAPKTADPSVDARVDCCTVTGRMVMTVRLPAVCSQV